MVMKRNIQMGLHCKESTDKHDGQVPNWWRLWKRNVQVWQQQKWPMTPDAQTSKQALENAFQTFNQLSDQLAESYHALEQQVSHLNEELTQSRDERLKELTEKEEKLVEDLLIYIKMYYFLVKEEGLACSRIRDKM